MQVRAGGHPQIGWPRRDQSTHKCGSPLGFDLNRSPWLRWQLENGSFLTLSQTCQEYNLAVWKLQCIVMGGGLLFVDLSKDRRRLLDCTLMPWPHSSRQTLNGVSKS